MRARRVAICCALAALSVSATTAVAAPPKRTTASLRGAAQVKAGASLRLDHRARPAKGRRVTRYALTFGDGTKPRRGKRLSSKRVKHTFWHAGVFTARLRVTDNRKRTARAKLQIRVSAVPGPSPTAPAQSAPASPQVPQPLAPIDLDAAPLELVTGSAAQLQLPAPLAAVTRIDPPQDLPAELTATAQDRGLSIAARAGAATQSLTVRVTGSGCTDTECERPFTLRVPVTVRALGAPQIELEHFTAASPDRVAAASPLATGGATLQDELVITLGTPDDPGTRADADEAAAAAGGVVSAGIDSIGVFEIRWDAPQDLEQRSTQLMSAANVAAVSPTNLGVVGLDAEPPGDWSDDGEVVTWPFTVTRAQQAWDLTQGSGVTVGIVDGGQVFGGHEDLDVTKKIGSNPAGFHATHVAGTACAKANGKGLVGFSWGCPIVTSGWNDHTDKGTLDAARAVAKAGAKVINMSMGYGGGGCASTADQTQLMNLASAYKVPFRNFMRGEGRNVVFTVSAGNNCAPGVPSPWGLNADLGNVISVAAINSDKKLASFSDFGNGVEVAAPGGLHIEPDGTGTIGIWSTGFRDCFAAFLCQTYGFRDDRNRLMVGTSMAAPVVAGIAAMVRSRFPGYGASRAAGCITGSAGAVVGHATERSTVPGPAPQLPFAGSIPIVDARAAVECESVQFSGSVGTGAPPATLGGYPMTAFGLDSRALGEQVSSITDPAGTILLSPSLVHLRVGTGWATWSHGYGGDVYFSGFPTGGDDPTVELTLPPSTKAFAFYAEPNTFGSFSVEAIASDGTSSEPVNIQGNSGARYFGFYGRDGKTLSSVTVTASDPRGFAIGEFQISR